MASFFSSLKFMHNLRNQSNVNRTMSSSAVSMELKRLETHILRVVGDALQGKVKRCAIEVDRKDLGYFLEVLDLPSVSNRYVVVQQEDDPCVFVFERLSLNVF